LIFVILLHTGRHITLNRHFDVARPTEHQKKCVLIVKVVFTEHVHFLFRRITRTNSSFNQASLIEIVTAVA